MPQTANCSKFSVTCVSASFVYCILYFGTVRHVNTYLSLTSTIDCFCHSKLQHRNYQRLLHIHDTDASSIEFHDDCNLSKSVWVERLAVYRFADCNLHERGELRPVGHLWRRVLHSYVALGMEYLVSIRKALKVFRHFWHI